MPVPRVAIVGRPNVGKSSLMNLIARERIAIVDPTPGVTRDRVSIVVDITSPNGDAPPRQVEVTDTGGFGVYTAEGGRYDEVGADLASLTKDIESQIAEAVSGADIILFAVDTQAGITAQDQEIARMLREQRLGQRQRDGGLIPVRVVATKVDGPKWEPHAFELAALGFDEPLLCSAKSGYFRRDMLDTLYEIIPDTSVDGEEPEEPADLKIAIVGKRNAGKSTLVNALAGEQRVIVSEIAGTTRDAVDVRFEMGERSIVAIDTAGLRRRKSFQSQIEWHAFDRAKRSIARADVVLLMLDATAPISQVDEHLGQIVRESFKPVVIVVNKWDLAEGRASPTGKPVTTEDFETYIRKELTGLSFAPMAFMSASESRNVGPVIELALELHEQACERVGTGKLNRLVKGIVERRGPSNKLGTQAKVYYVSQVRTAPPTIVMVVNRPELFTANYMRFMMNRLRESLPYDEVPIRLLLRSRRRAEETMKGPQRDADGLIPTTEQPFDGDALDMDALLAQMPDDPDAYFDD